MRILITGGAGFIGCNFVRWLLEHEPDAEITNLDALTSAGHKENLAGLLDHPRHQGADGIGLGAEGAFRGRNTTDDQLVPIKSRLDGSCHKASYGMIPAERHAFAQVISEYSRLCE